MGDRISKEIMELKLEIRALHKTIAEYLVFKTTGKTIEEIECEKKAELAKASKDLAPEVKADDKLPTSEDGGNSV